MLTVTKMAFLLSGLCMCATFFLPVVESFYSQPLQAEDDIWDADADVPGSAKNYIKRFDLLLKIDLLEVGSSFSGIRNDS